LTAVSFGRSSIVFCALRSSETAKAVRPIGGSRAGFACAPRHRPPRLGCRPSSRRPRRHYGVGRIDVLVSYVMVVIHDALALTPGIAAKILGSSPCQSQSSRRGAASGQRAPRPKSPKQGAENFAVIPGRPLGPGPEFKNTGQTIDFISLCSWIPGSRAKPAPRNDHPSAFFP
jgi:hypothetical protein